MAWGDLSYDVARKIYVKYCALRNADEMKKAAHGVAVAMSDHLVDALNTKGQNTCYSTTTCHIPNAKEDVNIYGTMRVYGTGRIITLYFRGLDLTTVVLKIKPRDGVYNITDCDYETGDMFTILVITIAVEHFNERLAIVNLRRPPKKWIKFHLRDKILSDLSIETNISVYRLQKILDSC